MTSLTSEIIHNHIYKISFKNNKKNSFSPQEFDELEQLLDFASQNADIKGLLFVSSDKNIFCAGGDLKYYSSLKLKKPGIDANKKITSVLSKLSNISMPTVACVSGLAVGGGVELLSCFDYIVSTNASFFSLWQRKIGLSFGWGGYAKLRKKITEHRLNQLFTSASPILSYQALKIGLIDQVVPEFKLEPAALSWLQRNIDLPLAPLVKMKSSEIKKNEQAAFEDLWLSEDHQAALDKFNKK